MRIGVRRGLPFCSSLTVSLVAHSAGFPQLSRAFMWEDRLVDSGKMKKAIESLYTAYLPKGSSPFVYIRCVQLVAHVSTEFAHEAFFNKVSRSIPPEWM